MAAASPASPSTRRGTLRSRPRTLGPAVVVVAALIFGYFAWQGSSSGNPLNAVTPYGFKSGDMDYYNLQADAFLHGRVSLRVPIDPKLKAAANPYDVSSPTAVVAPRLPDASFYDGEYYLSWGPAPALTTFLPAQLLGFQLRENLVCVLYAFFGVLFAWGILSLLLKRLVPETRASVVWAGRLTLALATALPWILRRPTVYEVALTGAFFFSMAASYVLLREVLRREPMRTSRLAGAGVLFGLAVLTRPTHGFVAVAVAGLAYLLRNDGRLPRTLNRSRARAAALVVGIPVAAGVLFMIYNVVRFSGPLDFGSKYQFGGRDVRDLPYNQVGNVVPALFAYLAAPLRIGLEFPYVHVPPPPVSPFHVPAGFGAEPTGSVLWAVPLTLFAVVALIRAGAGRLLSRGRDAVGETERVISPLVVKAIVGLLVVAALPLLAGTYAIPGNTERYEIDFVPWLVLAAVIGWAELTRRAATPRRAAWWRRGGVLVAIYGILIGVLIGFTGYYDDLKTVNRGTFLMFEKLLSPLPTAVTQVAGHPIIAGAITPGGIQPAAIGYTTLGPGGSTVIIRQDAPATLTIVSPGARTAELRFTAEILSKGTFVVTAAGGDGHVTSAKVVNGAKVAVGVSLKRGVNYVSVTDVPGKGVAPQPAAKPGEAPPVLPEVVMHDLRLAG